MTPEAIMERFREAVETLKHMPGDKPAGMHSAMPQPVRTFSESFNREAARDRFESGARGHATQDAIARLDEVLEWTLWLDTKERIVVWAKAKRAPNRHIERKIRRGRHTIARIHRLAIEKIGRRLETTAR